MKPVITYFLGAAALTAIILFEDRRANDEISSEVKALRIAQEQSDKRLCKWINAMHEVRGFKVLDCSTKEVSVKIIKAYKAGEQK